MSIKALWWPARRAEVEPVGDEASFLPGSFEPAETLGDTYPMPLDVADPWAARRREATWNRVMYAVVLGAFALAWFGVLA